MSGNHLAGFLVLALPPLATVAVLARVSAAVRMVFGAVVLVGLGGLVISTSRGGVLSALIGFLVVGICALLAKKRRFRLNKRIAVSFAVVVGLGVLYAKFAQGVFGKLFGSDLFGDSEMRRTMWDMCLELFARNQLLGGGAGSFLVQGRQFPLTHQWVSNTNPGADAVFAHNDHAQLIGEYGGLGVLLLAIVGIAFFAVIRKQECWRKESRGGIAEVAMLGVIGSLAGAATHAFFDFNMHLLANSSFAAMGIGLFSADLCWIGKGIKLDRRTARGVMMLVPVLSCTLMLIIVSVKYGSADFHHKRAELRLSDGHLLGALSDVNAAISLDGSDFSKYRFRAGVFQALASDQEIKPLELQWLVKAEQDFSRSKELFPDDFYCVINLGIVLTDLGNYGAARREFEKAVALSPNHRMGWYQYGLSLYLARDYTGSLEKLEHAVSLYWWGDEGRRVRLQVARLKKFIETGIAVPGASEMNPVAFSEFST